MPEHPLRRARRRAATARFDLVVDEPDGRRWTLDAALELGPIRVLGDIFTKPRPDLARARELAAAHLDLAHREPQVEDGIVALPHT